MPFLRRVLNRNDTSSVELGVNSCMTNSTPCEPLNDREAELISHFGPVNDTASQLQ